MVYFLSINHLYSHHVTQSISLYLISFLFFIFYCLYDILFAGSTARNATPRSVFAVVTMGGCYILLVYFIVSIRFKSLNMYHLVPLQLCLPIHLQCFLHQDNPTQWSVVGV
jgi:hypothetical protein